MPHHNLHNQSICADSTLFGLAGRCYGSEEPEDGQRPEEQTSATATNELITDGNCPSSGPSVPWRSVWPRWSTSGVPPAVTRQSVSGCGCVSCARGWPRGLLTIYIIYRYCSLQFQPRYTRHSARSAAGLKYQHHRNASKTPSEDR